MSKRPVFCAWCNALIYKESGAITRASKSGCYLYCGRECSGLGRRANKSKEENVTEKAEYDRQYRERNRAMLKSKKAAYFQATYDPEKAAIDRAANMPRHVEYCRKPEYKAYKRKYDLQRRADEFGEFNEAYMLLSDLEKEIVERSSRYDIYMANGTINKAMQRRREYDKAFSR